MSTHVDDTLLTNTIANYVRESLNEQGFDDRNINVTVRKDGDSLVIRALRKTAAQDYAMKAAISLDCITQSSVIVDKTVADIAEKLGSADVETLEFAGTHIDMSLDDGWVKCQRCDKQISIIDAINRGPGFVTEAELSHPAPMPYDVERFLRRVDDGHAEVLKLYLYGALRERCVCGFGKYSDTYRNI